MKKIYLILCVISLFYNASAQSLSIYNPNNNLQDTAGFYIIEGTVDVVNISGSTKLVGMYRKINNLAPGHVSSFCWGINCYSSVTDTSTYPESMSPNDTSLARADLLPMDSAGYSEVSYCWYDLNNPADSVCLTFTYDISPRLTGINETTNKDGFILFPNPFSNKLTITTHSTTLSEIILYDITSRKLLHQQFTNTLTLNTSHLSKGIYIYELRPVPFSSGNKNGVIKKGKVVKD
jgi:hypothetical protein